MLRRALDGIGQQRRHLLAHRPHRNQIAHLERVLGELADGEDRAVQRQRGDDHVDARPVQEASIHHRRGLVDAAPDLRHDAVDDPPQVFLGEEAGTGAHDDAVALDVDVVGAVDHDLGDGGVGQELLDGAEAHHVTSDVTDQTLRLLLRQRRVGLGQEGADLGDHHRVELGLVLGLEQTSTQPVEQLVMDLAHEAGQTIDRSGEDGRWGARPPAPGGCDH